jgi:hypothetical protein
MNRLISLILLFGVSLIVGAVPFVYASESQSISVTPPLFQFSVERGDIWQSTVRVVNNNSYPLTVFPEVVNFAPEGEDGKGRFVPVIHSEDRVSLAEWIEIGSGPYVIPPEQSGEIPFFVEVPEDASPGGHFATILISTEEPKSESGMAILTAQTVASLFFVRVEGDIVESAGIREFSILPRSVELPEAEFSLRFENKGNVHLQPRGDILIYNMWGTERGRIPVNHKTHFGNVLPETIRDFHFTWKGEQSFADIGRYKAIATLAYGEEGIQSVTAATYFWVIPVRGALTTLVVLIVIIGGITLMIRRYVRHMLILAGVDPETDRLRMHKPSPNSVQVTKQARIELVAKPLRVGAKELSRELREVHEIVAVFTTLMQFIVRYKVFFISLVAIVVAFVGFVMYINHVTETGRSYEVTIDEGDVQETLTDEEVEAAIE